MHVFDDYLEQIADAQQRSRTREVLAWVGAHYPALAPKIAWNQPMFTDHGSFIVGFSVARQHLAVAPEQAAVERFSDAIRAAGYEHTANLVRMPWRQAVDFELLGQLIDFNIADKADCATFWRKPPARPS